MPSGRYFRPSRGARGTHGFASTDQSSCQRLQHHGALGRAGRCGSGGWRCDAALTAGALLHRRGIRRRCRRRCAHAASAPANSSPATIDARAAVRRAGVMSAPARSIARSCGRTRRSCRAQGKRRERSDRREQREEPDEAEPERAACGTERERHDRRQHLAEARAPPRAGLGLPADSMSTTSRIACVTLPVITVFGTPPARAITRGCAFCTPIANVPTMPATSAGRLSAA